MFQINGILVNEECKSCAMKEGLMAAKMIGNMWVVPENAVRPADARKRTQ